MVITPKQFTSCFPKASLEWLPLLNNYLPKNGIKGVPQVAMFLAQVGHESGDFNFSKENLNYSKAGLLATFPKYFTSELAESCARNPEKIANTVYCNRMGNGSTASGEGFSFCGRGLIQITGKDNYTALSKFAYGDDRLLKHPNLISETKEASLLSAIWFWTANKLEALTDVITITKKINGGTNGLDDRTTRYNNYLVVLAN